MSPSSVSAALVLFHQRGKSQVMLWRAPSALLYAREGQGFTKGALQHGSVFVSPRRDAGVTSTWCSLWSRDDLWREVGSSM